MDVEGDVDVEEGVFVWVDLVSFEQDALVQDGTEQEEGKTQQVGIGQVNTPLLGKISIRAVLAGA